MAKITYAINIWILRDQFKTSASEWRGIRDLATFSVLIHLKACITVPIGEEAPVNDFRLMIELLRYIHFLRYSHFQCNKQNGRATSKKLGLHLWYISEELVRLTVFDQEDPAPDLPPKRPKVRSTAFLDTKGLE